MRQEWVVNLPPQRLTQDYIMDEPTLDLIVRLGRRSLMMAAALGCSMGLNLALLLLLVL